MSRGPADVARRWAWILLVVAVATAFGHHAQAATSTPFDEAASLALLKGIQADGVENLPRVARAGAGIVSINIDMQWFQPAKLPPCSRHENEFNGNCFKHLAQLNRYIATAGELGMKVMAVVVGTPEQYRNADCHRGPYCTPNNPKEIADIVAYLARQYNGSAPTRGRIDYVQLLNEVNRGYWNDSGCYKQRPCDARRAAKGIRMYADVLNASVAAARPFHPGLQLIVPFDNAFGAELDDFADKANPTISMQTYMRHLVPLLARETSFLVGLHPYARDLKLPTYSELDYPYLTLGNLGLADQWLTAQFPTRPRFRLAVTEVGANAAPPSSERLQAAAVCSGLARIASTPNIEFAIYHRLESAPRVEGGLRLGLLSAPSWEVWKDAFDPGARGGRVGQECSVRDWPHLAVQFGTAANRPWAGAGPTPPQFRVEQTWLVYRDHADNRAPLFRCRAATGAVFVSSTDCVGAQPLGLAGYLSRLPSQEAPDAVFRCANGSLTGDHTTCPVSGPARIVGYHVRPR